MNDDLLPTTPENRLRIARGVLVELALSGRILTAFLTSGEVADITKTNLAGLRRVLKDLETVNELIRRDAEKAQTR